MALSKDRNTPMRSGDQVSHPVAAGKKIHAGALVVLNASGDAEPGSTATTLTAAGMAEEAVDNSDGGAGAVSVPVRRGVFKYRNHSDAVTRAEVGKTCYIVDDETVAKTDGTGTRSAAGKVIDLDSDGVWVELR